MLQVAAAQQRAAKVYATSKVYARPRDCELLLILGAGREDMIGSALKELSCSEIILSSFRASCSRLQ